MRIRTYQQQLGISPVQSQGVVPNLPAGDNGSYLAQTAHDISQRILQFQNDTDDARTLELFNQFKQDSTNYHENPDNGIYNTRLGYKSKGLYSDADTWMRKKGEDYVQQLPSERAKANFRKMALELIQQQGLANSRFEAQQTKQYRIETAQATIKNNLIEAEKNWDNPDAIAQARTNIQQALELQMRGSGIEEFDNAYAEIENQLGVARIRQAYVQDPLRALRLLDDPDIHLLPETYAKLHETLHKQTEIYELQAIAQAFSQSYNPENSTAAYQHLIRLYGPDKGNRAFSQLNHIWSVNNMQLNAQQQAISKTQQENARKLTWSMLNPNAKKYSRDEIYSFLNSQAISDSTATHYINWLDAQDKADASAQQKTMIDALHAYVNDGGTFSNEQYSQLITDIGYNEAHSLQNQQKEKQNELKQAIKDAQADNANNFSMRFLDTDKPNPTRQEIVQAANSNDITPEKGRAFINIIEADEKEAERKRKELEKEEKQKVIDTQKDNASKYLEQIIFGNATEDIVRAAEANHEISPEQAINLISHIRTEENRKQTLNDKALAELREQRGRNLVAMAESNNPVFLSKEKMLELYTTKQIEEGHYRRIEELRNSLQTAQDKQAKSAHDDEIYNIAENFSRQYYVGHEHEFFDFINHSDYSPDDKRKITQYYNSFIEQQKIGEKNRLEEQKKSIQRVFNVLKLQYEDGYYLPDDELQNMFIDDNGFGQNYYDQLRDIQKQNEAKSLAEAKEKAKTDKDRVFRDEMTNALGGRGKSEDYYTQLMKSGIIDESHRSQIMNVIKEQKKAQDKVEEDLHKDNLDNIAKELFDKYKDNPEQAYAIMETYPRKDHDFLRSAFNHRMDEANTARAIAERQKIERQKQNNLKLYQDYYDKSMPVDPQLLRQMRNNDELSDTDYRRNLALNTTLAIRSGYENDLIMNNPAIDGIPFNEMTRPQQEKVIMKHFGTDEEARKKNVARLFQGVLDDTVTEAEIIWDYNHAQIAADDKERLIGYNSKFERQQKAIIQQHAQDLTNELQNLKIGVGASMYINNALNDFLRETYFMDLHAKNFDEALDNIYNAVRQNTITTVLNEKKTKTWYGSYTALGERLIEALNNPHSHTSVPQQLYYQGFDGQGMYLSPDGNAQAFDNSITIPEPQPLQQNSDKTFDPVNTMYMQFSPPSIPQANFRSVDMSKAVLDGEHNITSGPSNSPTALRNGRGHDGSIDISVPVGTNVKAPKDNSLIWQAKKVGSNNIAGNHIVLSTTLPNGDTLDVTYAHLDSIDITQGEVIQSGDVIAKSGNSGHTTGPHLHINTKINGKNVDPRNIDLGQSSQNIQAPLPVEPVRSSDAEVLDFLFGSFASGDKSLPLINFGANY